MQVKFFRLGYANNSSSTHSLIFVPSPHKLQTDESSEFGWHYFVSASKESKANWLLCALAGTIERVFYRKYEKKLREIPWAQFAADIEIASTAFIQAHQFDKLLELSRPQLLHLMKKIRAGDVYVDHQSKVLFPVERKDPEKIQVEFARQFCAELLDERWVIFGGNDNDGSLEDHPSYRLVKDLRMPIRKKEFIRVYEFLADHGPALCEQDPLNGDFVLSWHKEDTPYALEGSILRLHF